MEKKDWKLFLRDQEQGNKATSAHTSSIKTGKLDKQKK